MEAELNIAKILINKPLGTKLYADAFGELSLLRYIDAECELSITLTDKNGFDYYFYNNGKYSIYGEPIVFPSKEMRDWSKFAWKKGDVLVSNDYGTEVIFDKWYDNTYTNFHGKHYLNSEDKNNIKYNGAFLCTTARYSIEDKDAAQTYINTIEERLGGKLNLETLEIEKQPKFKDGDILFVRCDKYSYIEIFNYFKNNGDLYDHASLNIIRQSLDTSGILKILKEGILEIRLATDSEKQQLFDALAKKGKTWDAEHKIIVDLKPKIELKPFDKVLVRDGKDEIWEPAFFFRNRLELNVYKYQTVGGKLRVYCIPHNDETAKLIGTTNNWKGC